VAPTSTVPIHTWKTKKTDCVKHSYA
jgi:hypothetical protein